MTKIEINLEKILKHVKETFEFRPFRFREIDPWFTENQISSAYFYHLVHAGVIQKNVHEREISFELIAFTDNALALGVAHVRKYNAKQSKIQAEKKQREKKQLVSKGVAVDKPFEPTIEQCIAYVKSKGYKVMAPTTTYQEI